MNYYLIDFENVRMDGLKFFTGIKEGDEIVFFYSEHCNKISLDEIENLTRLKVKLSCYKVKTGTKNALDFQLSSYMGYLIGKDEKAACHIVSNDRGFDCLCDYWQDQGMEVDRISVAEPGKEISITPAVPKEPVKESNVAPVRNSSEPKKSRVKEKDLVTMQEINHLLSKEDDPETVLEVFNRYKTRVAINNGLAKKFKDSKKASLVYKKLKPLLKEKNKT